MEVLPRVTIGRIERASDLGMQHRPSELSGTEESAREIVVDSGLVEAGIDDLLEERCRLGEFRGVVRGRSLPEGLLGLGPGRSRREHGGGKKGRADTDEKLAGHPVLASRRPRHSLLMPRRISRASERRRFGSSVPGWAGAKRRRRSPNLRRSAHMSVRKEAFRAARRRSRQGRRRAHRRTRRHGPLTRSSRRARSAAGRSC